MCLSWWAMGKWGRGRPLYLPWRAMGRWGLAIGLVWAVMLWGWMPAASASVICRDVAGHRVCIESIKRSAKYLWEYRVVTAVDGQRQPLKVYDCRSTVTEATDSSLGAAMERFICNLVNR